MMTSRCFSKQGEGDEEVEAAAVGSRSRAISQRRSDIGPLELALVPDEEHAEEEEEVGRVGALEVQDRASGP